MYEYLLYNLVTLSFLEIMFILLNHLPTFGLECEFVIHERAPVSAIYCLIQVDVHLPQRYHVFVQKAFVAIDRFYNNLE